MYAFDALYHCTEAVVSDSGTAEHNLLMPILCVKVALRKAS